MISVEYAAGFFDGEGMVRLGTKFNPRVDVTNTDPAPLLAFRDRWGGSVLRTTDRLRRKPNYLWALSGWEKVEVFLRDIEPFCLVKYPQVVAVLRLCDEERKGPKYATSGRRITPEQRGRRARVADALAWMKRVPTDLTSRRLAEMRSGL